MTEEILIYKYSKKLGLSIKDAQQKVEIIGNTIAKNLEEGKVISIKGFGKISPLKNKSDKQVKFKVKPDKTLKKKIRERKFYDKRIEL
ncbi:HU family DNA-binding protein [Bacteroidota bacterium]